MTDNETISAWRGYSRDPYCLTKKFDALTMYDSDPAAWTPELYALIEERGLWKKFVRHLTIVYGPAIYWSIEHTWEAIKATPEQKARALARAIEEEK